MLYCICACGLKWKDEESNENMFERCGLGVKAMSAEMVDREKCNTLC